MARNINWLVKGRTYAVSSPEACEVATPAGVVICTVQPGAQGFFAATGPAVSLSCDQAQVTEVFNLAPGLLAQAGGGATGDPFASIEGDYLLLGTDRSKAEGRLDTLTTWDNMFQLCKRLTTWNIPLPALTDGSYMFANSGLAVFSSELPALTNGSCMFYGTGLKAWDVPLPALTNGSSMFYGTGLKSFNAGLPALANGFDMFAGCKLDPASLRKIADSLPFLGNLSKRLTLGVDADTFDSGGGFQAVADMKSKGWNVTMQYN